MWSACIFCGARLGRNAAVESFPVGLLLAFDAANGRLWVVCARCARWNLTPIEERWEAVEECERLFRAARMRVCTDNVGLATLHEGVDLVRIGAPLRPEFAAWRYGGLLGRRHGRQAIVTAAVLGGVAAVAGGALLGAGAMLAGFGVLQAGVWLAANGHPDRAVARVRAAADHTTVVRGADLRTLRAWGDGGALHVRLHAGRSPLAWDGEEAVRVAATLLPHVNRLGGDAADVEAAVRAIEAAGEPGAFLAAFEQSAGPLGAAPLVQRLALEMAVHEEREHRALEGDLAELERAWRDAEGVARIADALLTPEDDAGAAPRSEARNEARNEARSGPR